MSDDPIRNRSRLGTQAGEQGAPGKLSGLFGRIVAGIAAAGLVIAAFVFSLIVFAIIAAAGLVLGGWLWWRTRALRRQMREHPPGGNVVEGEVIEGEVVREPDKGPRS